MSNLVIVESPTKAKTISKFLSKDFKVKSSFGHIRDLPKKEMGVDVNDNFTPSYVVPKDKQKIATELKNLAKKSDLIYFATDEDREGEAIAWHLKEILNPKEEQIKRITFHEITKSAIDESLKEPRSIDMKKVDAQQARRILDRLVGYELSPFLWKKVVRGLSAGRVQSVAVRLIVEREREIQKFKPKEYWTIEGIFSKNDAKHQDNLDKKNLPQGFFHAKLHAIDQKSLKKFDLGNEKLAKEITKDLEEAKYKIAAIEHKETKKTPPPPFTTSSIQQEANRKLGYSSKQTMVLAQQLYEGIDIGEEGSVGLITYMRTDSVTLSTKFLTEAKNYITKNFGSNHSLAKPRLYKTKSRSAQEAHEAIRPTEAHRDPESVKQYLDDKQYKLYRLIWQRSIACQMSEAILDGVSVDIETKKEKTYTFRSNGQTVKFPGYLKVYSNIQKDTLLPELEKNETVDIAKLDADQHFTEPPARYSDASLVKALEEHEIGRPSTYAPTISTITDRGYVERIENRRLKPTDIAFLVNDVLVEHFPQIVDYEFTAKMENNLDDIAEGELGWEKSISEFYTPFKKNLTEKTKSLKREDVMKERIIDKDPDTGLEVIARMGRFGPFVQLGEWSEEDKKAKKNKPRSASLGKGQHIDTITLEQALKLLSLPKVIGQDKDGQDIVADVGRFGPYLKCGKTTVSVPENIDIYNIELSECEHLIANAAEIRKKMAEPIAELGQDPNSKGKIIIKNGRFGPYITDGKTNVSIGKKYEPKEIKRDQAIEMLEKKRKSPKRAWGKKK